MPSPNPATRYHILGGGKITTLASGIDSSALSFTVNDASGWPGVAGPGAFWIVADAFTPTEEKMLCTSRTGNVVTVTTRGVDGTSAVAHTANTGNWYPVIAAGIIDPLNEHAASTSAVHGVAGSVVGTTDTQTISAKTLNTSTINSPTISGTVAGGGTYTSPTLTTPTIASFTNATHNHGNAAGGGNTLSVPTIADFTNAGHNHSNAAGGGGISVTDFTNSQHDHGDADDGGALVASITLTTPTIASFTNATHNHSNATGGGSALTPASVVTTGVVTSGGVLTHNGGFTVPRELWVSKATLESVTSSTAMQNDDELVLALEANVRYLFMAYINYQGAAAGDIQWDFTGPAGATGQAVVASSEEADAVNSRDLFGGPYGQGCSGGTGTASDGMTITGSVITVGTAGNLQFRWAQLTSSGTATSVRAGSWLRLTRA